MVMFTWSFRCPSRFFLYIVQQASADKFTKQLCMIHKVVLLPLMLQHYHA